MSPLLQLLGLPPIFEIVSLVFLIVIGIIIIVIIAKVLLFFLPAAIIAAVVWFLTRSLFLAGVAFLIIAVISVLKRK